MIHLLGVGVHIGLKTNGVMMRTTMLNATGMEVLVAITMKLDGMNIVQIVNVLIPMLEQVQLVKIFCHPRDVKRLRTKENVTRSLQKRNVKKLVVIAN